MKPLHLAVVALSLAAAVAHAQPAPADVPQQATRAESATGRVDRSQSNPEDPNACVGPVSFCNVYFGS
ncbi:hypothetical protein [Burkholderia multivorans]|uniref:hypothetical protein n=1 Tax=Burkholderia multivorans TaxID=87883 RepID=UPI00350FC55F